MLTKTEVYLAEEDRTVEIEVTSDSKPEIPSRMKEKWQDLVDLMLPIYDVPVSLIMQIQEETIDVFLADSGKQTPYKPGQKENLGLGLYCETVLGRGETLEVEDATENPAWEDNPDVEHFELKYYLGMPIKWPDGELFGTLCILDTRKRKMNANFKNLMGILREFVEADLQNLLLTQRFRKEARLDPLTNTYNRRYLKEYLDTEVGRAKRYGGTLGFVTVDIDRFKLVNDRYSHSKGDEILIWVAELLKQNVRRSDKVVRMGGDEFLLIMPETDPRENQDIAKRLQRVVEEPINSSGTLDFPLSVTLGTSIWTPSQDREIWEAIEEADRDMLANKKTKRAN